MLEVRKKAALARAQQFDIHQILPLYEGFYQITLEGLKASHSSS